MKGEKKFYNREETNSAAFSVIQQISIKWKVPFHATQIINHFLNSIISANSEKGDEFQQIEKSLYPLLLL